MVLVPLQILTQGEISCWESDFPYLVTFVGLGLLREKIYLQVTRNEINSKLTISFCKGSYAFRALTSKEMLLTEGKYWHERAAFQSVGVRAVDWPRR